MELQWAADGVCGAVDKRAVVKSNEVGSGVVGEGVLHAVNTDGARVCRAVVLPEERGACTGASRTIVNLTTPTILPEV